VAAGGVVGDGRGSFPVTSRALNAIGALGVRDRADRRDASSLPPSLYSRARAPAALLSLR
jgi:hypothetical protein